MTTAPAPAAADTPSPYVEVTPRYLAGPGEARYVIGPLSAVGWRNVSAPHSPVIRLITPDGRVRLTVDPDPDQWFWRIHAQAVAGSGEASWEVTFSARVPAEILAGFTNALILPEPAIQARPLAPLAAGGWTVDDLGSHWALSPDHAVSLTHATVDDSTRPWFAQTSVPRGNGFDEVWAARFGEHTPHYLITAFTTALADTAPLVRHRSRTPPMARSALVTRPSDVTADSIREQLASRERAARTIRRTRLPRSPAVPDPKPGRRR